MSTKLNLISMIKNTVETLPINEAFLLDLQNTVSKLNPIRPRSTHYKPSSLHCMRMMYFDKVGATVDATLNTYSGIRITETGTASHECIQSYVSKMRDVGVDCEFIDVETYVKKQSLDYLLVKSKKTFETKLYDTRYDISFLCDGIIKYKGEYFILEIKTETEDKGLSRDSADPYHKYQSVCYSLSLGINQIMWIYEERNYCVPKTFITHITDTDKLELVERLETVDTCVKNLTPPERCNSKKTCTYCIYKNECKKYR